MKIAPKALIFVLGLILIPNKTKAQENKEDYKPFKIYYNVEYKIDSSLETQVNEQISLVNLDYLSAPSQINIKIKNLNLYDLKVENNQEKKQQALVSEENGEFNIKIPIKDPAIGKDKTTTVNIYYKSKDFAQRIGKITTISVPKPNLNESIEEYNITLFIPKEFGPQISITPTPHKQEMKEDGYILKFKKENIKDYAINASFGDYQIFSFEIKETLTNNTFFNKIFKVPVPPNLKNYQEVAIKSVNPKPVKVYKDLNDNALMYFKLKPKQKAEIKIVGQAKAYTLKLEEENPQTTNKNFKLNKDLKKFTKPTNLWPSNHPQIKDIANNLSSPKEVYDFVIKNISYDYQEAQKESPIFRKGVLETLKDKNGLCLDFSDLFITLLRSINIPAREITGYAYSKENENNNLGFHAWAQYHHPNYGWVSVDPTWGATTQLDYFNRLDNNHLAFVINAGEGGEIKLPSNIQISFSENDYFDSKSDFNLWNLPLEPWPYKYKLMLILLGAALTLGLYTIYHALKGR